MDRCPKDEPTAKKLVWNKSSPHSRETLEKPFSSEGGGGGGGKGDLNFNFETEIV